MLCSNKILQCIRELFEAYDNLEFVDERLVEMEGESTYDAIMSILMIPESQKYILTNEGIFKRYEEALIPSGR